MIRGRILLGALAFLASGLLAMPAAATVTLQGTEGVYNTIINGSTYGDACTGCHFTGSGYAEFDSISKVNAYAGSAGGCITENEPDLSGRACMVYRIDDQEMPTTGALSATGQSKAVSWQSGGFASTATPQVSTTGESGVTKYGATLNGNVQENGIETSFDFEWGTSVSYGNNTTNQSPAGTGGGGDNKAISDSLSSLSCGTTYHYRVRSINNGTYGGVNGANDSFTTSACPSISGIPDDSITEDQSFSVDVKNYDAGTLTNPSVSYSLDATSLSRGMTITNGVINWSAANVPDAPTTNTNYSVTVTISDGVTSDPDTFVITVTPVNDAPVITSGAPPTGAVEGSPYSFDINATDADNGAVLTYSLNAAALSAGMTINSSSGLISWTPDNSDPASLSVVVTVSDGSLSDTESWTISVTATNDPPTIINFSPPTTGSEDVLWSYQLEVNDIDDDEGTPGNITYTLTCPLCSGGVPPTGMSVSSLGLITWTPTEAQVPNDTTTTFGTFSIQVEDGNEDGSTPSVANNGIKTFSIDVAAVNDAPVLSGLPDASIVEQTPMTSVNASLGTYLQDPDDSSFTWGLSGQPSGMAISSGGTITYTPGQFVVPPDVSYIDFTVTVQVNDPDSANDTDVFALRVYKQDVDGDLIADYDDNCLNTANNNQFDNDNDGVDGGTGGTTGGDACDTDDDNDSISDEAEVENGLDPFDASDGTTDLDGDGVSNADEFAACVLAGDPLCGDIAHALAHNGDLTVVATGYYTPVELSATAYGMVGGVAVPLDVTVDDDGPFRPGVHVLTWTAKDRSTPPVVVDTATQTVTVIPTVSLGGTVVVGEGMGTGLEVRLNGDSPEYPVVIDYAVGGTASPGLDHDLLLTGSVAIGSGTGTLLLLQTAADGVPEGDETLEIVLTGVSSGSAELSPTVTGSVLIVEQPLPPEVADLQVIQDAGGSMEQRTVLYRDQGAASIEVFAVDPNGDAMSYSWSNSSAGLGLAAETASQVTITPSLLAAGSYEAVVRVSDGVDFTERRVALSVVDTTPALSAAPEDSDGDGLFDVDEGLVDLDGDGLLDYLDGVTARDTLPVRNDTSDGGVLRVVQVEPGFSLVGGALALAAQNGGAQVSSVLAVDGAGDPVIDPDYLLLGALYDVIVGGTVETRRSATVAFSLPVSLPPDAVWRVFINGDWFSFASTATDRMFSAASVDGQCPSPDADAWATGLTAGHDCVRLTISDGGPNDADGAVNGRISTTGGSALSRDVAEARAPSAEQGGTIAGLFLCLLALAGFRIRRHGK
ncbi:MAG: putative Ig domain-containing protein [Pseudomonadota bacterium]